MKGIEDTNKQKGCYLGGPPFLKTRRAQSHTYVPQRSFSSPPLSYFSFCQSYHQSPWEKLLQGSGSGHTWGGLSLHSGWACFLLPVLLRHALLFHLRQPHSPHWAAVPAGRWRGVPGRNAPTWSPLRFHSTGAELKVRDRWVPSSSWRRYHISTEPHVIRQAEDNANIL